MRLRYRIAVYLSIIILLALTATMAVTASKVGSVLRESGYATMAGILNVVRAKVENQVQSYRDLVTGISLSPEVRKHYFERRWDLLERDLERFFKPVRGVFKNGIFVLDRKGDLVCDFPPSRETRGKNFAFREYFRDCRLKRETVLSPPYRSARTGKEVLTFAAPLLDAGGNFSGLIAASLPVEDTELLEYLEGISLFRDGKIGLYTMEGRPLYEPYPSLSSFVGGLVREPAEDVVLSHVKSDGGEEWVVGIAPVGRTRLALVSMVPRKDLYLPLENLNRFFVSFLLGAFALSLAAAIFLSQTVVSRIEKLKDALSDVEPEAGQFPRVPLEGSDEVGELIEVFNRMSTELEKRTRQLKESQDLLRSVTSSIDEYIYRVEVKGKAFETKLMTERVKDITGFDPEEFFDNPRLWLDIVHPEDRKRVLRTFVKEVLRGDGAKMEYRIIRKDGEVRHVQNSVRVTRDEEGRLHAINGTVVDVTEMVLMEQQLQQSQRIRAIGMLAGGIAHDFNNILSSILGYVSLLKERVKSFPGLEEEVRRALSIIENSAQRGAELTKQLLGFAMRGKFSPRPIDLNRLVKENIEMVKRTIGKNITVVGSFDESLPPIKADPAQITQVLMNLCINARDAMPKGGELTIKTESNPSLPLEVKATFRDAPHGVVLLSVRDTGVGMDEETLNHAFEPFFTTKEQGKGTGLGLSTVYGIVKNHGGDIVILSEKGKGTEVKVFFPATDEAPDAEEVVEERRRNEEEPLTVMVVDDENFVREFLAEAVSSFGHRVIECSSGEEALREFDARERRVDLVILDMLMPGMDGKETLARLRKKDPSLRVIVASGYLPDEDAEALMNLGVQALLRKPFRVEELRRVIDEIAQGVRSSPA